MKRLCLLLAFAFTLNLFAQSGDDAMPAYILVKAQDGWNPDDPMVYQTGYPVDVRDISRIGGSQVPPKFIQVVVTDATVGEAKVYCDEWKREIDWSFVSHNFSTDHHVLNVFTKASLVSASGLNGLTRDKVEAFLTKWNAVVQSIAANSVVFDAGVFDAIASDGFWGRDTAPFTFTEKVYNSSTGIHGVEINYAGSGATAEQVAEAIVNNGCTVTKNIPNKMEFDCNRDTVFGQFKLDVFESINQIFARRKWYFTQAAIDAAYANGGSLIVTRQQALAYLHNRLTD